MHCKFLAIHDSTNADISKVAFQPLDEASLEPISLSLVKHSTEGDLVEGSSNVSSMSSRSLVCRSPFFVHRSDVSNFPFLGLILTAEA